MEGSGPTAGDGATRWADVEVGPGIRVSIAIGQGAEADEEICRELESGTVPAEYRTLLRLLEALAPSGGRVLDLGGHVGTFALGAAALGYRVAVVEASPRNAGLLRASVGRNGFEERLRVVEAAVGERPGTLEFCPFGPYGHVVTDKTTQHAVIRVPSIPVDRLLVDLGWDGVDFVKMDVEGSEVAAIRGMPGLLGRGDAPPIVYESNGHTLRFTGQTPKSLKSALEGHGYRNYAVEADRLIPVASGDLQGALIVDYLAIKRLPAALKAWRVDGPTPRDEALAAILGSARSPAVPERAYAAATLAGAPRSIRARGESRSALAVLRRDPCPEVREAAKRPGWLGRLSRG